MVSTVISLDKPFADDGALRYFGGVICQIHLRIDTGCHSLDGVVSKRENKNTLQTVATTGTIVLQVFKEVFI